VWPEPKEDLNTERERRLSSSFIEPVTWCDGQKGFAQSKGLTHHVNGEIAEKKGYAEVLCTLFVFSVTSVSLRRTLC